MTEDIVGMLDRVYADTAAVIMQAESALDAPTPCEGWSVRDVANHVVGGLVFFAGTLERDAVRPDPDAPDPDYLGGDPAGAYSAVAQRCLVAFGGPGALDEIYDFVFGPTSGLTIANISLQESLIHGWDMARGAGLAYAPDPEAVGAVARFNAEREGGSIRREGMFGPEQPVPSGAGPFEVLLGRLGRTV
jgi:uncharacterized protein (TIGR03086 family)